MKQWKAAALTAMMLSSVPLMAGAQDEAVTVCILDSGCDDPRAEGKNYLDDGEELSDEGGHGAFVYQILAEQASDARLYMLKCFSDEEETSSEEEKTRQEQAILQALYDAVDVYQADVINISWTLNVESEALHEAIAYAYEQGSIVIAAAGNLSLQTPLGSRTYPAGWEEVIGVGGVDLDADGNPVSSLWYLQNDSIFVCADGHWQGEKGTSFAAPKVTAIVARYLQNAPEEEKNDPQVREYLKEQAQDLGESGYDTVFGWGYVEEKEK